MPVYAEDLPIMPFHTIHYRTWRGNMRSTAPQLHHINVHIRPRGTIGATRQCGAA